MSYPVRPVTLPGELQCGAANGRLSNDVLADIGHNGRLSLTAARAWNAMYVAAAADGFAGADSLTWTPGGTYRTLDMQHSVFIARYEATGQTDRKRATDRFYSGLWWRLRGGNAQVATPGTSNHGLGLAVDLALGETPSSARSIMPAVPWLLDNAASLGWSWEVQSEPWHLRYVAGSPLPRRVTEIEAWVANLG